MHSDLQSLIERACDLQEKVNEEININSKKNNDNNNNNCIVGFCSEYYCSGDEDKWFCKSSDMPLLFDEETHRLIGLRDSLKQVEDMLIHLQVIPFRIPSSFIINPSVYSEFHVVINLWYNKSYSSLLIRLVMLIKLIDITYFFKTCEY